jgi:GT2 family glycosyltransferase
MTHLSIIIVSYNTKNITNKCLNTLLRFLQYSPNFKAEIIIVDNGSTDTSVEILKKFKEKNLGLKNIKIHLIFNRENLGFAKANNEGLAVAEGKYILFLNSDVIIEDINFEDLIYYMNKNPEVGVLTVRVRLPNGKIDMASHRGFPTLWSSFTYFSGLETIFKKIPKLSKIFGGYHLTHLDLNTIHEIDSPSGAFYLTRKAILDKIGGFDTKFFMYGEDLDLSFRIKKMGYKIIYYPLFTVTHFKYQSGLKKKTKHTKTKNYFYEAMKIFYDKHFAQKNGKIVNKLTHFFIDLKKKISQ